MFELAHLKRPHNAHNLFRKFRRKCKRLAIQVTQHNFKSCRVQVVQCDDLLVNLVVAQQ